MDEVSFLALARGRAESQGDANAYTFLRDGENDIETLTYAELDRKARAIAAVLQHANARGQRLLLLYPPGLEYVTTFLGCIYAGAVAVPAYPPDPSRLVRTLPRLESVIDDAGAAIALTSEAIRSMASVMSRHSPTLARLTWLATDTIDLAAAERWCDPGVTSSALAVLQYTSGSTGTPRGVMLTHGNLLHNSTAIHRCFAHGPQSRGVIWLPPYHDMGLIGGVLQPLCGGFPVVLMSPLDFLRKPVRWLAAISRYRATTSGGPNFAYDLCVRKVTEDQRRTLDLSSWDLAFNGAEPIHAETLERFAAVFASCGFRRQAFYPCYGLAETTLIASGGAKHEPPVIRAVSRTALEAGGPVGSSAAHEADGSHHLLVGCGHSIADQELLVVEPTTCMPLPDGRIGEIWLRGPSVAAGYWNRDTETAQTFHARRNDTGEIGYLRTGDLGFLARGEVFITGRIKDLIILRGRNLYPQDLERTAGACHVAARPGCTAAFTVTVADKEHLVVVQEIDAGRGAGHADLVASIAGAIRAAVAEEHEVHVEEVILVPAGRIPKTSSGKVQRGACRATLLDGALELLARSVLAEAGAREQPILRRDAVLAVPAEDRPALLRDQLSALIASTLGTTAAALPAHQSLTQLGLDSIHLVELAATIEDELGISLAAAQLLDGRTLDDLVAEVVRRLAEPDAAPALPPLEPGARTGEVSPSFAQERLLFLERLAPDSPAYNVAAAVMLDGRLDVAALERSLAAIVARHEVLRARFAVRGGEHVLSLLPAAEAAGWQPFDGGRRTVDLTPIDSPAEREATALRRATALAREPLRILDQGPVVRAELMRLGPEQHLLAVVIHHIAVDGWSMGILVRELGAHYTAFAAGATPELPELHIQYSDYAAWQRRVVQAGLWDAELAYWKSQLAGAAPLLELREARPRPSPRNLAGARCRLELSAELTAAVHDLARVEQATPFMILLAGFAVVLAQRTGQSDLLIGTDIANRDHIQTQKLLGFFVNQVVLRIDTSGAPSFRELVGRVRQVAIAAYANHHLPFDKVVEGLRPPRDPGYNAVFQIMFVLENAPMPNLELAGLSLRVIELDDGGSPFDLSILLTESGGRITGALRYSTDLFDPEHMERLGEDLAAVLAASVARPGDSLHNLHGLITERGTQRQRAQARALELARNERFQRLQRRPRAGRAPDEPGAASEPERARASRASRASRSAPSAPSEPSEPSESDT